MADDLKHLEEHSDEIRELVETLVQNHLLEAANANQYCPKCVAVILLEWATFAATCAGATVGEITGAIANGAATGEEETERMETEIVPVTQH
jgi:predicted transcriptional regulator